MNCMKCGRENTTGGVFCEQCQAVMEKYPVKPNIVVQLPHSSASHNRGVRAVRRTLTPEEQIRLLKKQSRRLRLWLFVTTVMMLLASALAVYGLLDEEFQFLPGQNYSVEEPEPTSSADPT